MTDRPRRNVSIGLKQLLLGAGGGILLCCTVIAVHFLGQARDVLREAEAEARELARYEAALIAVSAIAAERGPANNAMTGDGFAVLQALHKQRMETDSRLAALVTAFRSDLTKGGSHFANFALLQAHLRSARSAVDRVAALPKDRRDPRLVASAVHKLFHTADAAFALRDKLGAGIINGTQNLSAEILLLNEAGAFREMTGRLGSHVVLLMAGSRTESDDRAAMITIRAKLDLLWHDLRLYAPAHLKTPAVRAAVDATNRAYFAGSLPYLEEVMRRYNGGEIISAKTFTDRYVPGLKAVEDLRAKIIRATIESADNRAREARWTLFGGIASFGAICLLLFGFAFLARRLLFAPLLSARNEILALAADDLEAGPAGPRTSRELEAIFDGIAILRRQLLEKKAMEQEQQRLTETLRFLSERDPLTQLLNRRTVEELAVARMRDSDSNRWPLGVLIVDLDHFKRINDNHGHAAGDLVLKATADQMRRALRSTDVVARFGGEEFLIILDLSDGAQAADIAERMRRSIAAMHVRHDPPIAVTASIGLCIRLPGSSLGWSELVATADRRLYSAKAQGRNRVCAKDGEDPAASLESPGGDGVILPVLPYLQASR